MSQTTYTVTLSIDGNHQVSVASDNMAEMKLATTWAKTTYESLKERYGVAPSPIAQDPKPEQLFEDGVPICPNHQAPMAWVDKGSFFSCHKKNDDGSWCKSTYRPPKAPQA